MAADSFCCRVFGGRQHVSPRALQFASRAIAQGVRQCTGRVCAAQGDRITKALYEFVTGRTIGQMPFDFSTVREWQFEIRVVRKQGEDILATLRMAFHAEEPGRPEIPNRRTPQPACSPRFRSRARGSGCCGSDTPLPPAGRRPDVADPTRER